MVKYIPICLLLCFLQLRETSSQESVTITMDTPAGVEAGASFTVKLEIQKGSLEEFSRFQQELPYGLEAEQLNSSTADFSFENQRIRFIWLKLPPQEVINLSYKVTVHPRLKGDFALDGVFSYVEQNERKSVDVSSDMITITPSSLVASGRQVDINEFTPAMAAGEADRPAAEEASFKVSCIRQAPYLSPAGDELMVNLLVYKKDLSRYAKIEEKIPEGFEAKSMESRDGIFTFQDGVAKFVWMNLPPDEGFSVTYRLIPVSEQTLDGLNITGTLSYMDEGSTISTDIVQKNVDLSEVEPGEAAELMAGIQDGSALSTEPANLPPSIGKDEAAADPAPGPSASAGVKPREASARKTVKIPAMVQLPVQDGIYFRIQLAALEHQRGIAEVYGGAVDGRPVKVEYHEGLFKYTIGTFSIYEDARAYKTQLLEGRKISDGFVTAYRNGRRMDVTEARSLTSDK